MDVCDETASHHSSMTEMSSCRASPLHHPLGAWWRGRVYGRSDALEGERGALADADAHGGESPSVPPRSLAPAPRRRQRAPDMPSGWPSAMAPPWGFTCSASSARPRPRRQASAWAAKASFSSITSKSPAQLQPLAQLARRRDRADAHHPRRDAGRAPPWMRASGSGHALHRVLRGQQQRRRAVVDARRVAGGDGAVGADDGLQLRQRPAWCRHAGARPWRRASCRPCGRGCPRGRFSPSNVPFA